LFDNVVKAIDFKSVIKTIHIKFFMFGIKTFVHQVLLFK